MSFLDDLCLPCNRLSLDETVSEFCGPRGRPVAGSHLAAGAGCFATRGPSCGQWWRLRDRSFFPSHRRGNRWPLAANRPLPCPPAARWPPGRKQAAACPPAEDSPLAANRPLPVRLPQDSPLAANRPLPVRLPQDGPLAANRPLPVLPQDGPLAANRPLPVLPQDGPLAANRPPREEKQC